MLCKPEMDDTDRKIALFLQDGLPLVHSPFQECANALGIDEREVVERIGRLRSTGGITRLGPFFNAAAHGRATFASAPCGFLKKTGAIRSNGSMHSWRWRTIIGGTMIWNMWFVIAVEQADKVEEVADRIEAATGLAVYRFPQDFANSSSR